MVIAFLKYLLKLIILVFYFGKYFMPYISKKDKNNYKVGYYSSLQHLDSIKNELIIDVSSSIISFRLGVAQITP